jgi:hypothetical protein
MRTAYTQLLAKITTSSVMHVLYYLHATPSHHLGPDKSNLGRSWRCQEINTHWRLLTLPDFSGCNECQHRRYTYEAATSLHWQKVSAHVVLTMTAPRMCGFSRGRTPSQPWYKYIECLLSQPVSTTTGLRKRICLACLLLCDF